MKKIILSMAFAILSCAFCLAQTKADSCFVYAQLRGAVAFGAKLHTQIQIGQKDFSASVDDKGEEIYFYNWSSALTYYSTLGWHVIQVIHIAPADDIALMCKMYAVSEAKKLGEPIYKSKK